ncbi:hypothetical protein CKM354_000769600 [Cercospora kikuchii]|uniref:Uncharacterized protein n=1 Tax=Cercospora kikuchii TaxID=84275 RepID=A0A9P3CHI2_9PEZI|nr:uncharacterized protein CKM354_000769600 [Cercospora kikuchii]GIZ44499.1 hypothetical protein CKM354_000769600 [Cercospora kikuchii]
MAKVTTNKMSPKPEPTTCQAMKAKRPCDFAATAHINALLSRDQFIAGLVHLTSRESSATNEIPKQPTDLDMFNPFDSVFLFSAPDQTIALMAKFCIKIGARTTILTIPAELRLRIYEFAFAHWEEPAEKTPLVSAWDHLAQLGPQKGGPPILRTCKLFRREGMKDFEKFHKSFWSMKWRKLDRPWIEKGLEKEG